MPSERTADEMKDDPEGHILVSLINRLAHQQKQINDLLRRQNVMMEAIENAVTSRHERERIFSRLTNIERMLNLPEDAGDVDSHYS